MSPGEPTRRGERGFTYLGLLFLVVLIGLMLAAAGEVASTAAQRDREAQLLWVGHQYQVAIQRYWSQRRAYPLALQDLVGSAPDAPIQVRYIRQLYRDPMTNAVDWVLLAAPRGGIMGIASSSKRAPLKTGHFEEADKDFADATAYRDWQFTFPPGALPRPDAKPPEPGQAAGGTPGQAGGTAGLGEAGPQRDARRSR